MFLALSTWSHREHLPCCTFIAAWLIERTGVAVSSVSECVAAVGIDWWRQANVWDRARPWSALEAARDMHGGALTYVDRVAAGVHAPPLTLGRWHVVQRWRGLRMGGVGLDDDRVVHGAAGHTYLAYADHRGGVRIVQSSESRGYRDTTGTWTGTAGLDGYSVAVLTLPPHVQE